MTQPQFFHGAGHISSKLKSKWYCLPFIFSRYWIFQFPRLDLDCSFIPSPVSELLSLTTAAKRAYRRCSPKVYKKLKLKKISKASLLPIVYTCKTANSLIYSYDLFFPCTEEVTISLNPVFGLTQWTRVWKKHTEIPNKYTSFVMASEMRHCR